MRDLTITAEYWSGRGWIASCLRPAGPRLIDVIQAEGRTEEEARRRCREQITGQREFDFRAPKRQKARQEVVPVEPSA